MNAPPFRDAALGDRFREDGYVVVDLLSAGEVEALKEDIRQMLPLEPPLNDPQGAAYASFFDLDRRADISALVGSRIGPVLAKLIAGYRPLFSTIFWKPGRGGATPVHQHSPYVADLDSTVINCWCPLIDCDAGSGTLQVVPRSHALSRHVQTPSRPAYWHDYVDVLERDYLVSLAVRAGQAVLFEDTMLHGAAANDRAEERLTTLTTLIQAGAVPAFVLGAQDAAGVDVYRAPDRFAYSDMFTGRLAPEQAERIGRVSRAVEQVDLQEFRRRLRARGISSRNSLGSRLRAAAGRMMKAASW